VAVWTGKEMVVWGGWGATSTASAMVRRDSRVYGKATPAFLTWLKSSRSNGLRNQKSDETRAASLLWGKRRATPAHAPQENAGQLPGDRVIQGNVNYIVH
jgi:hypothetical protein